MEFSVTKSALLNELSMTQGVVERKTTIPILSNLLVEAKGSQLTITATDLELSIRTSCEAKVKKEGAGTIPAKKLLELVRLLPEGEIKVKLLENHWVEIISDRKKYKLVGMAKENFPALPAMPHTLVKIPAAILQSLIAKTKFAISMEESRYTLNGGLLVFQLDADRAVGGSREKIQHVARVESDGDGIALVFFLDVFLCLSVLRARRGNLDAFGRDREFHGVRALIRKLRNAAHRIAQLAALDHHVLVVVARQHRFIVRELSRQNPRYQQPVLHLEKEMAFILGKVKLRIGTGCAREFLDFVHGLFGDQHF